MAFESTVMCTQGYTIPPNYDSMIGKLIATGQSRDEVITRMKRALSEFIIEGVKTTIPFHLKLMDNPIFRSEKFTTKFLETSFDFFSTEIKFYTVRARIFNQAFRKM